MRTEEFRGFLEDSERITSKNKAVTSRVSKATIAETIIGRSLDVVVNDDSLMQEALLVLKNHPREKGGNLQNAVRWYYFFANGKHFPRLSELKNKR